MGFLDFLFRRKKQPSPPPPLPQSSPDRTMFGISAATETPSSEATQYVTAPPAPAEKTVAVTAPPKPRARLVVTRGGAGTYELSEREYALGRSSANDIVLADPSVSGQHAKLVPQAGGFAIRDLGSTNGTKVDGEPVGGADRPLRGGETLALGEVQLTYERG